MTELYSIEVLMNKVGLKRKQGFILTQNLLKEIDNHQII